MTKNNTPKELLVVDDHAVVRRGFRQLLNDEPDLAVRWEAATLPDALKLASEHHPDLALVDVTLAGAAEGIDLTKRLRNLDPAPLVLVVSMHDEALYARRALAAGAQGYIMKRAGDEKLVRAVHQVVDGRIHVSDAIRERLFESMGTTPQEVQGPVDQLSDREMEVFMLVGQGYQPRHIAEKLLLSVKTVNTHRRHLKQKLGVESSAELLRYAIAWRVEHGNA